MSRNHWVFHIAMLSFSILGRADKPQPAGNPTIYNTNPAVANPVTFYPGYHLHDQIGNLLFVESETELTYAVPAGAHSFSVSIVPRTLLGEAMVTPDNAISVAFRVDGTETLRAPVRTGTPETSVTLMLSGTAHQLVIQTTSILGWDGVYLFSPVFGSSKASTSVVATPAAGTAYLSFADPNIDLCSCVDAGASITGTLAYSTAKHASGELSVTVTPEDGTQPFVYQQPVSLKAGTGQTITFSMPSLLHRGPAQMLIALSAGEVAITNPPRRIAVLEPLPARAGGLQASGLGTHISSSGFISLQDEIASKWGAGWGRVFLRWNVVDQAGTGQFDFHRADQIMSAYAKQGIKVLGVLGEIPPASVSPSSPNFVSQWNTFVAAAVQRYGGQVSAWDLYNEPDAKYYSGFTGSGDQDITLLSSAIPLLRAYSPRVPIVCCSTGSTWWQNYDARLENAGIFSQVDVVSNHPYMRFAPEEKQGLADYLDTIDRIKAIEPEGKPVWSTEANWLLGFSGYEDVTEQLQADFLVRVNLLSSTRKAPYFAHSPWLSSTHPEMQLSTLAAYRKLASFLSAVSATSMVAGGPHQIGSATPEQAQDYRFFSEPDVLSLVVDSKGRDEIVKSLPEDVYAVHGSIGKSDTYAVWARSAGYSVQTTSDMQITDIYGNATSDGTLGPAPIYVTVPGGETVTVNGAAQATVQPTLLPDVAIWAAAAPDTISGSFVRMKTIPSNYGYALISPVVPVDPQSCYEISASAQAISNMIMIMPTDGSTGQRISEVTYLEGNASQPQPITARFHTMGSTSMQVVISNANPTNISSEFVLSRTMTMQKCSEQ